MFIKTQSGKLLNLALTGSIYIQEHEWYPMEWSVAAFTGAGHESYNQVDTFLFSGSKQECLEYMDNLIHALQTKELWLPVLLPIKGQL